MRIAWCPQHRGVMRISFFNPKPPHFDRPCPRCQGVLIEQVRNKYELSNPRSIDGDVPSAYEKEIEVTSYPDEVVTPAPPPLCNCCETMKAEPLSRYCNWCQDCPTEYCSVPSHLLQRIRKRGNLAR